MRIVIEKDALCAALQLARLAVSKDQDIVTSAVLFQPTLNAASGRMELTLRATDGMFTIHVPVVPDEVEGQVSFAVQAKRLHEWLNHLEPGEVVLEVTDEGLLATAQESNAGFALFDIKAFGRLVSDVKGAQLVIAGPSVAFLKGLQFVKTAIGTETSNNDAANQFQVAEFNARRFFASDTHVISLFDLGKVEGFEEGVDTLIKVGRVELGPVVKFLELASSEMFRCTKTDSFYYFHADDGSCLGFSIPQFTPKSITGLDATLIEKEVWVCDPQLTKKALGALDATRTKSDTALTLVFPEISSGESGTLRMSMRDVMGRETCHIDVEVQREAGEGIIMPPVTVHIEWLRKALAHFPRDSVQIGVQLGRTSYLKFTHYDEGLQSTRATLMAFRN